MKEQDLKEKFKRFVNGYVGSSMLTNTEYPEVIESNAEKCVKITVDYAREEAIEFGNWMRENTIYLGSGIYFVGYKEEKHNQTLTECYQLFKTK